MDQFFSLINSIFEITIHFVQIVLRANFTKIHVCNNTSIYLHFQIEFQSYQYNRVTSLMKFQKFHRIQTTRQSTFSLLFCFTGGHLLNRIDDERRTAM